MEGYDGCGDSGFVVPKSHEDSLERYPSPDSWSNWGISAPEGFDSKEECLIMDTDETEVEFNFIDESFNDEIEFDPCLYDHSSSSSVSGGQSFQQTTFSCHHEPKYQLQDLSTFDRTDDIFLDSVLEDFPGAENLHKSFFYPQNQCSNLTGGVQKDIAASEFDPCNSDSKDCLDIEAIKVLDPLEQSNGDETMFEQSSLEECTLQGFEMLISQFPEKTRICFRDALHRLARNTRHVAQDLDGDLNMHQTVADSDYNEITRYEDNKPMESKTNNVDRAIASLMFTKMEINILDLPPTTLVNLKQEVFRSKCPQGKSSKSSNVTQKSHYPHPEKVSAEAVVPRFGLEDQEEATESYLAYVDPTKKHSCLSFLK